MIKSIVFDMGNVLLQFSRERFLDAVGAQGEDRRMLLNNVYLSVEWARMDRGSMTEEEAAESMCRRLPERLHEKARALVGQWDREILPVPGMAQLVRELKEAGYGIYLLSNASYRQSEYWPHVPGNEYFDGVVVSAFEGLVKPERAIYDRLLTRFALRAEECLFIDDLPLNIEGAERAGMPGIVFHGDVDELRAELREHNVRL